MFLYIFSYCVIINLKKKKKKKKKIVYLEKLIPYLKIALKQP